jgi:hypothetical protein
LENDSVNWKADSSILRSTPPNGTAFGPIPSE